MSSWKKDQKCEEGWGGRKDQVHVGDAFLEGLGDKSAACKDWGLLNVNPDHRHDVLLLVRSPVAD
eukprot:10976248-Alexandrium_andersonii.AAC.1